MHYEYEVIHGIFQQSESGPKTNFEAELPHFGSIDLSIDRWKRFVDRMKVLNTECSKDERVVLLWLGRHGQGYHNAAIDKYGEAAWEAHYSRLNGDSESTWGPDPYLTPLGEQQARDKHALWVTEHNAGLPLPDVWYCSPMRRAASTLMLTFGTLRSSLQRPVFVENAREEMGIHSCDKRSTKTIIASEYPTFDFSEPFVEEDVLWQENHRESEIELTARVGEALKEIFDREWGKSTYISITAHCGAIRAMTTVLKHRWLQLVTGGVLPVVVKVKKVA